MGAAYREGSQDSGSLRDVHVLWQSLVPLVCDSPAPKTASDMKIDNHWINSIHFLMQNSMHLHVVSFGRSYCMLVL